MAISPELQQTTFAENFNKIYEQEIAPAMTAEHYRNSQNAGSLLVGMGLYQNLGSLGMGIQTNCPPLKTGSNLAAVAMVPESQTSAPDQLTFWSEEHLARISQSPDSEQEWTASVVSSQSNLLDWLAAFAPAGWYGRTSPACCRSMEEGRLEPFSDSWGNSGMGSYTEYLTLNTSEYPSDGAVCSLSDILETGDVPQRYFLSAKACRGILRRAEKRGKELPSALRSALQGVASQRPAQPSMPEPKTDSSATSLE